LPQGWLADTQVIARHTFDEVSQASPRAHWEAPSVAFAHGEPACPGDWHVEVGKPWQTSGKVQALGPTTFMGQAAPASPGSAHCIVVGLQKSPDLQSDPTAQGSPTSLRLTQRLGEADDPHVDPAAHVPTPGPQG
jgi:hypothetical protein